MAKPKIYKIFIGISILLIIVAVTIYSQLSIRQKGIVKTTILHKSGLMDGNWSVTSTEQVYNMFSPTFLIDGIYKSMEGPLSGKYVQLSQDSTLIWMTGFTVSAIDSKTKKLMSNDFVCHTNIDFNDVKYFSRFNLPERIGHQYPRLTSLSNGSEKLEFPAGYGIPMYGNDMLYITTQALNHNRENIKHLIKHRLSVNYTARYQKPLMSRTAFIMLPFDAKNPAKPEADSDRCLPVDVNEHTYDDGSGNILSGHWIVPNGKKTYRMKINSQLKIQDSLRLHTAAIHVHPFAKALTLYDKTSSVPVFASTIVNKTQDTGLEKVPGFSSQEGIWLYANHDYELILEVDNTSGEEQDMMACMFFFFYDAELDARLESINSEVAAINTTSR